MQVGHVVPSVAESWGGPARATRATCAELAAAGVGTAIWTTGDQSDILPADRNGVPVHVHASAWPSMWMRSPALRRHLAAEIGSLDLLHLHGLWLHPSYAAAQVARRSDRPYILRPCGDLEPWMLRRKGLKKRLYMKAFGRRVLCGAACVHAVSDQEARHLRQAGYDGPIAVVPHGLDLREYGDLPAPAETEVVWPALRDRRVALFLSRLSPQKGLDVLIPAWARLAREKAFEDCLLVLAGPDYQGHRAVVERWIEEHGLSSRVLLVGMVKGRQRLARYRRADVFVLPSHSENFGLAIAEALACGTPVITTVHTPWSILSDVDAGRWVSDDAESIANVLRELLQLSEAERAAMGERGRRTIHERHALPVQAARLRTLYRAILAGESVPDHPDSATAP